MFSKTSEWQYFMASGQIVIYLIYYPKILSKSQRQRDFIEMKDQIKYENIQYYSALLLLAIG